MPAAPQDEENSVTKIFSTAKKQAENQRTTTAQVGAAVGMSAPTYAKAKHVVDAAHAEPEKYGDLPAKMDATGNVDRAFKELGKRKAQEEGPSAKEGSP